MPDAFFQKKRKRTTSTSTSTSSPRAAPLRSQRSQRSQPTIKSNASTRMRKSRNASDSSDNDDDAVPGGGIDEMDLAHRYDDGPNSDDEAEAAETPAEARVRLAKMYLEGLSSSASTRSAQVAEAESDDDFFEADDTPTLGLADAAQADRDNIAARLQKDVAEHTGKIHLYLASRIAAPTTTTTTTSSESSDASDEQQNVTATATATATVNYDHSLLALRGHRLSVTCAVASADAKWVFTASKDGSIIRWRLRDGKMVRILPKRAKVVDDTGAPIAPTTNRSKSSGAARRRARMSNQAKSPTTSTSSTCATYLPVGEGQGHTDEVWTLSLSSDGQYLASGGKDGRICIWSSANASAEKFIKTLSGHKDSVTALSFRTGSLELYTASLDRTLKLYDVSQLSYIETLFGHQESVLSLSCLGAETAVSAGGRDRTCRYWKIRDESQLVFRAGIKSKLREVLEGGDLDRTGAMSSPHEALEGSVEVVAMIDNNHFVSGGDSGAISLWNLGKKKPIFTAPVAHGFEVTNSESEGEIRTPRWITAIAALPYSDVFVSGSWDGSIRVWGLTTAARQVKAFRQLFHLPAEGVVNSLQIISPPLASVLVDNATQQVSSTAVDKSKYKRRNGLHTILSHQDQQAQDEQAAAVAMSPSSSKLPRLAATKDNCPPIIIAAVGQEHRLGRWLKLPHAKNGALVIPLLLTHPSTTITSSSTKNNLFGERRGETKFKLM